MAPSQGTAGRQEPGLRDLFKHDTRRITFWVTLVCGISLTAHWAFMFWHQQHLRNLPEVLQWTPAAKNRLASLAMYLVIGSSVAGNFAAAWLARRFGYRSTIVAMFFGYWLAMLGAYGVARDHIALLWWFPLIGFCQGAFALFTMYLPPLFPTLLRTTGPDFPITSAASQPRSEQYFLVCCPTSVTTASLYSTPGCCSCPPASRPCICPNAKTERPSG